MWKRHVLVSMAAARPVHSLYARTGAASQATSINVDGYVRRRLSAPTPESRPECGAVSPRSEGIEWTSPVSRPSTCCGTLVYVDAGP